MMRMTVSGKRRIDCRLSVVIPAYNESRRIVPTLDDIMVFQRSHELGYLIDEVIVVDDGSRDSTAERAMWYWGKINGLRVEMLPVNRGKWAAIRAGLMLARNEAVLLLDADGSASIADLGRIDDLGYLLGDRRMVFGSRFMLGATVDGKSGYRTLLSHGYRLYVQLWYWVASGRTDVDDMQCPFKIVFLSRLRFLPLSERWCGDMELASAFDGEVYNHPVQFVHKAGSRVRASTVLNMAWETARSALRVRRMLREFAKRS